MSDGPTPIPALNEALATMYAKDWCDGVQQWAAHQAALAHDTLLHADPTNSAAISRAQAAELIWTEDVPKMLSFFQDFAQQQNAKQPEA